MPRDLTVWDWAFDSPYSPLSRFPESELRGFQNAITKERINWKDVKECTTYLSTALVKKYGLKEGDTVALFSRNTIWYPVAMLGTLRAGKVDLRARGSDNYRCSLPIQVAKCQEHHQPTTLKR